jgi:hypothetical protein
MDDILSISVWSDKNYEFFQDPTERNIKSNYPEYQTYAIAYLRRFNRLIDILEVSKQFLPAFVMPKDKTEGLIDIFLDGFPNIGHARAVYKQGIKAEKRSDRKIAWVDITKLYMKAIADYGDRKRDALDMEKRFSAEGSKRKVRPPLGVQHREQKRQQDRGEHRRSGVHHVAHGDQYHEHEDYEGRDVPEDQFDTDPPDDLDQEEGESDHGYDTAADSQAALDNNKREDEEELAHEENDEDEYLNAVVDEGGKRVCFEFARTGKCSYQEKHGKCNYSHDKDAVTKFKAAELLGPDFARRSAKIMDSRGPAKRGNVHVTYNPGHKGTSPGIRAPFGKHASRRTQRSGRRDT